MPTRSTSSVSPIASRGLVEQPDRLDALEGVLAEPCDDGLLLHAPLQLLLGVEAVGHVHGLGDELGGLSVAIAQERDAHQRAHGAAVGAQVALHRLHVVDLAAQQAPHGLRVGLGAFGVRHIPEGELEHLLGAASHHPAHRRVDVLVAAVDRDDGHADRCVVHRPRDGLLALAQPLARKPRFGDVEERRDDPRALAVGGEDDRVDGQPAHVAVLPPDAEDRAELWGAGPQGDGRGEDLGRTHLAVLGEDRDLHALARRVAPDDLVVAQPEDLLGRGIAGQDLALAVDEQDALLEHLEHRAMALLAAGDVGGRLPVLGDVEADDRDAGDDAAGVAHRGGLDPMGRLVGLGGEVGRDRLAAQRSRVERTERVRDGRREDLQDEPSFDRARVMAGEAQGRALGEGDPQVGVEQEEARAGHGAEDLAAEVADRRQAHLTG